MKPSWLICANNPSQRVSGANGSRMIGQSALIYVVHLMTLMHNIRPIIKLYLDLHSGQGRINPAGALRHDVVGGPLHFFPTRPSVPLLFLWSIPCQAATPLLARC